MKTEYSAVIYELFSSFEPASIDEDVAINFVPIIANPETTEPFPNRLLAYGGQLGSLKQKSYVRRKYYEGSYVMRIIVKPKEPSRVYYFQHLGAPRFAYLNEDGKVVEPKISQLARFIRRRTNQWTLHEESGL